MRLVVNNPIDDAVGISFAKQLEGYVKIFHDWQPLKHNFFVTENGRVVSQHSQPTGVLVVIFGETITSFTGSDGDVGVSAQLVFAVC
jgi:hypothetical protein